MEKASVFISAETLLVEGGTKREKGEEKEKKREPLLLAALGAAGEEVMGPRREIKGLARSPCTMAEDIGLLLVVEPEVVPAEAEDGRRAGDTPGLVAAPLAEW